MYKSKGLKNISIQKVKDYFVENKFATKNQIAKATELSPATITNILKDLLNEHYIQQIEDCDSTGGRKAKQYQICASYMLFGLIDLRVQKQFVTVECRIVDLDFTMIKSYTYQFAALTINALIELIEVMKKDFPIQYVGISVPGIVNEGCIEKSDIEELENTNLKVIVENNCHIPVIIENDVNTVMLGYIHIHVVESQSVAFVYQPDNHHSGCGLYINHQILYGATHFAGELAYLPYGTLMEQEELLHTHPLQLLLKQVSSIIAIMNPSLMILYTPCVTLEELTREITHFIPKKHLPKFQYIQDMERYVFEGLASQCIENSRYKRKGSVK